MTKAYLGDSVYVDRNERFQLVLTTENGIGITNTIYLEPEVYQALVNYVESPRKPKSSMPAVGDVVDVFLDGHWGLRTVAQVGSNPPYVDCLMVEGLYQWLSPREYRVPDINNYLQVPLEEDDECPNCNNGTMEKHPEMEDVCRGECGAFFRGPLKNPTVKFSECERLHLVKDKSQVIREFLEWLLSNETKYVIAEHLTYEDGEEMDLWAPANINIESLLAQYFKIDLKKVEKEKRAILDKLRKKAEMKAPEPLGRPCGCRDLRYDPDWDSSQPGCSCEGTCDCHDQKL
jgi:hypothetical protein